MTIENIEQALTLPLPGKVGQYIMAPSYRPDMDTAEVLKLNPKIGGVLLLLNPKHDGLYVVFTLRKKYLGTHSGQMSFPGGKREENDIDITATALRETHEEIGVPNHQIKIIGSLTELYIPPSHFLVYPTVGVLTAHVKYQKQEAEVEEIIEIPLDFFLEPSSVNTTLISATNDKQFKVPAYIYQGYVIWGATAIMMSEFVYMLQRNKIAND